MQHKKRFLLLLSFSCLMWPYGYSASDDIRSQTQWACVEAIGEDVRVPVVGGHASSFQPGADITQSFDGDYSTDYHSSWNNAAADFFPITLEYRFERDSEMDYFIYYPRKFGRNGLFGLVEISYATYDDDDGPDTKWHRLMDYDFKGYSVAVKVNFPGRLTNVMAIRFTMRSGIGDGQGFVSCAEMEFYRRESTPFDYGTLFTDPSCSALKPGIGKSDIRACRNSFYRELANRLSDGSYDRRFRVRPYRAYPHPDVLAASNKTNPYSLMDNPTGISVSKGETLVVLVSDYRDEIVSLRVQNLDAPDSDGALNAENYPLSPGVNKFCMKDKGLVYVMYHSDKPASAPPVTLHFVTGTVNGYYDSQDPAHRGRAQELLDHATDDYFDVLGRYAHLTFPVQRFRQHTRDLDSLIAIYDRIVYNELELLGLVKYGRMPENRMYLNVMYHSYMYAMPYRMEFHDRTLADLCNEDILTTSACWGPAHEMGHGNQTSPGMKWLGTTEVTNNIMSEYIQTTVLGQPSRLQVENMNDEVSPNRYSKSWNSILVEQKPHAAEEDVFCKLVPFWQLELYLGKVKGLTPHLQADKGGFYPDVFEYYRTHPDAENAGRQQLEFVYVASLASGMDLTDFFRKWGFLTPVDLELTDYVRGRLTVTKADVDAVVKRVKSLGYPKPAVPLEYITDNTVGLFRSGAPIRKGTALRTGDRLVIRNWENVVAYEVRKNTADGPLVCVSDGVLFPSPTVSFSVKGGWDDSYRVYAVAVDNSRVEVELADQDAAR